MNARRIAAYIILFAIVALRIEPQLLRLPFMDRKLFNLGMVIAADGAWRQYPRFIGGVCAHTRSGDTIAIAVPPTKWDDGYSYAYYRGSYFLPGRIVLPLVTEDDKRHPENLRAARYVAAWHLRGVNVGRVVWAGEGGVLLQLR
jgi:hypothetical protein